MKNNTVNNPSPEIRIPKIKKGNPYITLIIFIIGAAATMMYFGCYDNTLNNVIVIMMVFILFFEGLKCRSRVYKITADLRTGAYLASNSYPVEFQYNYLKELFAYYTDRKKKADNSDEITDISYYINIESIYKNIYKDITDLMPGLFTGIGIFGTFLGLIIGLSQFNTTDITSITGSIQLLLDGIKVAFYTSIFGVGASLIYNYRYKKDVMELEKSLDKFYESFYENVEPGEEDIKFNQLKQLLTSQITAVNALPQYLAEALVSDTFSKTLANAVKESVQPTMLNLEKRTTEFIDKAVSAQSDILKGLVEQFMNELNSSLKNQFNSLSESIEHMCSWQNKSVDKLSSIFEALNATSDRLEEINEKIQGTILSQEDVEKHLSNYLAQYHDYIRAVHEYQYAAKQAAEEMQKGLVHEREFTDRFKGYNDNVQNMTETVNNMVKADMFYIKGMQEQHEDIKRFIELVEDNAGRVSRYNESLSQYSSDINSAITEMAESVKGISKSLQDACGANVSEMQELNEKYRNMVEQYEKERVDFANQSKEIFEHLSREIARMQSAAGFFRRWFTRTFEKESGASK